jgi:hypothetical protein
MSTTTMHRAAVDAEFRAFLESQAPTAELPAPVEELDRATLESWASDVAVNEIYACVSSCSFGPITWICDGTTKSGI